MSQNLQTASELPPADAVAEPHQDARSLIDQLNAALMAAADEAYVAPENAQTAPEQSLPQVHSFANAIMRQTDQIQYLAEQINRLDSDTEVARLRAVVVDLCGALTEVTLRMKQETAEASGKIGQLTEAVTIIGAAAEPLDAANVTPLVSSARAVVERLLSLERISTQANAAVLVLEESDVRNQNKVRDLSTALMRLNDSVQAGLSEIAGLERRIGSADEAFAQSLTKLGEAIEADRGEITGLWQRVESADQALARDVARLAGLEQRIGSADLALAQGLARLGQDIEAGRGEIAGLGQRIGSADQALARLSQDIEADRSELAGLEQRIGSADRALAQGLARLAEDLEEGRKDTSRLQQRVGSIDQALGQGLATLNERTIALRDELERAGGRLASMEDGAAALAAFKDKINALNARLGELEQSSTAEIRSWRIQESERNAALISKVDLLEQKNHALSQGTEQMAVRLNAAEQTIAAVMQRQKALSSVHDRVVRLLLANPDLQT